MTKPKRKEKPKEPRPAWMQLSAVMVGVVVAVSLCVILIVSILNPVFYTMVWNTPNVLRGEAARDEIALRAALTLPDSARDIEFRSQAALTDWEQWIHFTLPSGIVDDWLANANLCIINLNDMPPVITITQDNIGDFWWDARLNQQVRVMPDCKPTEPYLQLAANISDADWVTFYIYRWAS